MPSNKKPLETKVAVKKPIELGVLVSLVTAGLALIGTIVSLSVVFGRYSAKIDNLEKDVQSLLGRTNGLQETVYRLEGLITGLGNLAQIPDTTPVEPNESVTIVVAADEAVIPLDAGWRPEGSIANNGGGYRDGELQLKANLTRANDYAELFLDLVSVELPGIKRSQDGSYNLAGMGLEAIITSDQDFRGYASAPNGVQFLVKEGKNWKSLIGPWLNVTPAMNGETGMKVFYKIPDAEISRNVAGISIKFTINSKSSATYKGNFFVKEAKIKTK